MPHKKPDHTLPHYSNVARGVKEDRNPRNDSLSESLRSGMLGAARFWEPRRVLYNLILTAVVIAWLAVSWPHFRPAFHLYALARLLILALLANVCYSAAYFVDIPVQWFLRTGVWGWWRWALWLAGTLFAVLLANYWIADEIYPFVR